MPDFDVVWSDKAERTYNEIIEYLNSRWTEKEVHHFIFRTVTVIEKITKNPFLFKQYKNNPQIRQAVLHETVILIYEVLTDNEKINLLTFWGTRQNPQKLKLR